MALCQGIWNRNDQSQAGKTASHLLDGQDAPARHKWLVDMEHEPCEAQSDVEAHDTTEIGNVRPWADR
jgi:hypothetical protein